VTLTRVIHGNEVRVTITPDHPGHARIMRYERRRPGGRWATVKHMRDVIVPWEQLGIEGERP